MTLFVLGLAACAAACGESFESEGGGSGGTAAAGGTATGSGTTTGTGQGGGGAADGGHVPTGGRGGAGAAAGGQHTGGQGGSGEPCIWGLATNPCGSGRYCNAPNCVSGVCEDRTPFNSPSYEPVCGCDGITYWNDALANMRGMAVAADGECAVPTTCGGVGGIACPNGQGNQCAFDVVNEAGCSMPDAMGKCWNLPPQCPDIGPMVEDCWDACMRICDGILSGSYYFKNPSCM